jgi:translation initiation factor 1
MSRHSKKVSIQGSDSSLADNPFAGLAGEGLPAGPVVTPARAKPAKSQGRVELRREKAGRGGKTVTTLREFQTHIPLSALNQLTFDLKKACACGGALKGRVIELQGDVRERVMLELQQRNYRPVQAGG